MFLYVQNRFNPRPIYVTEDSLTADILRNFYVLRFSKAPYLELPGSIQEFRRKFKKKFLYNIKWEEKKFCKEFGDLEFRIMKKKKDIMNYASDIFVLFNERWKSEYTSSKWKYKESFEKYFQVLGTLAEEDEGFLACLVNRKLGLLSYAYCLNSRDWIFMYQHTTKRINIRGISLGKILIFKLLTYAINNKFKYFDFMVGESEYKMMWTKKFRWVYRLFPRSSKGYLDFNLYKVKYKLQFNPYLRPILKKFLNIMISRRENEH